MTPRKRLFDSTVMIRMPDDLRLELHALAKKAGRNLSDYCRAALRDHVQAEASLAGGGSGTGIPAKLRQFVREVVVDYVKKEGKRHGKA